jgi:hypothetical protein
MQLFLGQGQSKHSLGSRKEKARHVSAAGFLFITQCSVINSDNGLV